MLNSKLGGSTFSDRKRSRVSVETKSDKASSDGDYVGMEDVDNAFATAAGSKFDILNKAKQKRKNAEKKFTKQRMA